MKRLILLLLLFAFAAQVHADNISFTASVSKSNVTVGERFQVSFSLNNAEGSQFRPPGFTGFKNLSGPNTSTQMSIVNGRMTRTVTYSYILEAQREGLFKIDPATIVADGKKISSNSVNIIVGPPTPEQEQRRQAERTEQEQAEEIIRENLFITVSVNKQSALIGEPVVVTYKLYKHLQLQIYNPNLPKTPAFTGFWAQDIADITKLDFQAENYKGVTYHTATLKRVMLIPQQTGNLNIDQISFSCVVRLRVEGRRRSRGFFDDFFDDSHKDFPYTASSRITALRVRPLPDGDPASFNGGVGTMNLEAWLDKTETRANEPVTLKVKITGNGNLKLLEPLPLKLPPDIESYDPRTADNLTISNDGFTGSKIFEYLLMPRNPGEFRIEPLSFSYYDLAKKSYVTLSTKELLLKVAKGTGEKTEQFFTGVQKENIKYLGKDIRFIKTDGQISRNDNLFLGSPLFFILSLSPFLMFIGFILLRKRNNELNNNVMLLRNRKATKVARRRLSTAKKMLKDSNKEKFYEEISKALWGYASDKLGIPVSDLSKDSTNEALIRKNVPEELINRLLDAISDAEFARFAPAAETYELQNTYESAVTIISQLEGKLR